jgi:hypothetical protein
MRAMHRDNGGYPAHAAVRSEKPMKWMETFQRLYLCCMILVASDEMIYSSLSIDIDTGFVQGSSKA